MVERTLYQILKNSQAMSSTIIVLFQQALLSFFFLYFADLNIWSEPGTKSKLCVASRQVLVLILSPRELVISFSSKSHNTTPDPSMCMTLKAVCPGLVGSDLMAAKKLIVSQSIRLITILQWKML